MHLHYLLCRYVEDRLDSVNVCGLYDFVSVRFEFNSCVDNTSKPMKSALLTIRGRRDKMLGVSF